MRFVLGTSLEKNDFSLGPVTLPLLTDALAMRQLTMMPVDGGLLAIAQVDSGAPATVFSSQMRESLSNIFALLPLVGAQLEEDERQHLNTIQSNCYQLLRLTSNLETGLSIEEKSYMLEPLDLASLVSSLCSGTQAVCRNRNIPIRWQASAQPVPIRGNRRLLSEMLLNLMRNSLQYTRDGNHLHIRLAIMGSRALLTVADRGLGIKPENLQLIYLPYYSADPFDDGAPRPGLGLGLSVVRQVAICHGGTVSIESRFGEGTRVVVALPLAVDYQDVLESNEADYLLNRYSPIYVHLCDYCHLPLL